MSASSVPVRNLKEIIEWAKAKKRAAPYASFGNGFSGHLGFERFKRASHIEMIHVTYKREASVGPTHGLEANPLPLAVLTPSGKNTSRRRSWMQRHLAKPQRRRVVRVCARGHRQ